MPRRPCPLCNSVHHADDRRRPQDLTAPDHLLRLIDRHPAHGLSLVDLRFPDKIRAMRHVDVLRRIRRPDRGLERQQELDSPRTPARFLLDLPRRRSGTVLAGIDVTERKASFLMDTARAFLQCGRHERAYLALRAAEEVAPEEITGRPAAHRLVRDLMKAAPLSIQRHAEDFARRIGATE